MSDDINEVTVSWELIKRDDASPGDEVEIRDGVWATFHGGREVSLRGPWTGVMDQPLPDWLDRVVQPLLRDFQLPTPIALHVGYGKDQQGRSMLWIQEPGDPGPSGFGITESMPGDDLVVELASWLQDQFFLETAQAWGQPRPPCPGHQHPLYAGTWNGAPYWFCSADQRPVARIGQLASQLS
jgi:hypothetical protein